MNPKRQRFCEEYAVDLNGAAAACRAGYAPGSAKVTASRLLTNDNVRKRVDELIVEYRERVEVSVDSITELFREDRRLAHKIGQAGAAVSATEKLAKLHGLLTERLKVDVRVTTGQMSDAEIAAGRDEIDCELIKLSGREGIKERIAHDEKLLVRFDRGEFDDVLPPQFARVPKSPPLVVLGASEFQSAKQ